MAKLAELIQELKEAHKDWKYVPFSDKSHPDNWPPGVRLEVGDLWEKGNALIWDQTKLLTGMRKVGKWSDQDVTYWISKRFPKGVLVRSTKNREPEVVSATGNAGDMKRTADMISAQVQNAKDRIAWMDKEFKKPK